MLFSSATFCSRTLKSQSVRNLMADRRERSFFFMIIQNSNFVSMTYACVQQLSSSFMLLRYFCRCWWQNSILYQIFRKLFTYSALAIVLIMSGIIIKQAVMHYMSSIENKIQLVSYFSNDLCRMFLLGYMKLYSNWSV